RPGVIDFAASARADTLADAVRAQVPVRRGGSEVVAAEYGSLTGAGLDVPVKLPAKALPGSGRVSVTLAPTLVGGLRGAFAVMSEDPLHSWEVRLSRSVLASDYLRLKPMLGDAMQWPQAAKLIKANLVLADKYQAANGGMGFWGTDPRGVSSWLSVYTALAFDWLREAGHEVPAKVDADVRAYLRRMLTRKHAPVLRAGTLAALALSPRDKTDRRAVAAMLPSLPKLRLFGQALLLQAAVAIHDRSSADAIVRSLFKHAEESAGGVSFNEHQGGIYVDLLATPLRSNCAILDALSRYHTAWGNENLVGSTPQKLARWVGSRRRNQGGWPNSQENVFCTSAIVHYADAYERPVQGLEGRVSWPGRKLQSARFDSRRAPAVRLDGPAPEQGKGFAVQLAHSGKGRLYYDLSVHYVMPPFALPAADAGLTITRHYAVRRGKHWQPLGEHGVLHRGDLVRVELVVDTPTERHHVVVDDPLPGTFEAVDPHLATSAPGLPASQDEVGIIHYQGGGWPSLSFIEGGFYHRETAFDAVRFFADTLPAGRYHLSYTAQVLAAGTFLSPAPTVKEIYQPDVFGRGLPVTIKVTMPDD
ncbi:MAG TPA: hypothetical protein VFJ01_12490, partial [Oleiagrimonas sp.]|nr:hypothetical protein [Oleiagrimonas sp.]